MGNNLRCCLGCVLPCGALDLIRVVHLNGRVEEITHPITAGEILQLNPNHVLSKPCSQAQAVVRKIIILSPESQLKRGSVYFLIPDKKRSSTSHHNKNTKNSNSNNDVVSEDRHRCNLPNVNISEKKHKHSARRDRHHVQWRPRLANIFED